MSDSEPLGRPLSWGVHLLTASGAVLGVYALIAIATARLEVAILLMLAALFVDSVDGTLARAVGVRRHVPEIDGRRLDDMVDFLNFVIVPCFFFWGAGQVLHPGWLAAPVLASAYGFSREDAKTEDDFFLGFPSYWNVLAIYLFVLGIGPLGGTLWIVGLSLLVFVPFKYLYPSKVEPMALRVALGVGGVVWAAALAACIEWPEWARPMLLGELTLGYPAWYLWLSFTRGGLAWRRSA
ncbi:MAG: CDP-alcohol phosphatidyltransferase family protein [Spirochaetaceae bacterium]|nr:CDP-alcohol phosphatidyltransferase family protein [Myxococcales bacterium]MCB9723696.1 CDP-alcohol phosphatidyltransferase family protein [Spirochaetaceae bacterium]